MISTIFKVIQERLSTVEEIRTVDMFSNQIYNENFDARLITPAAYIEIPPMTFDNRLRKVQTSDFTVRLHIVLENQSTYTTVDKESSAKAIAQLEILDKVFKALHSEAGSNEDDTYVYRIVRQGLDISKNASTIRDNVITLRLYLVDVSLIEAQTTVTLGEDGLDITITNN